jgi:hypothetical protein
MSSQRDIKLDAYEIDKFAFRECKYFCLQYPYKKKWVEKECAPGAAPLTAAVHGSKEGRPTEKKAMNLDGYIDDVRLIETTAMEAGGDIYEWLLKAVTEEKATYNMIRPPIGVNQFNRRRRLFFLLLAVKKGLVKNR